MNRCVQVLSLAMAAATFAGGCATITRGTKQDFTVVTEPPGASVEASNGLKCEATPCTFKKVDRETDFTVTVSKPGYQNATYEVRHKAMAGGSAGMLGNVLIGGVVGIIVDANSGATQDLYPNPLTMTLVPEGAPAPAAAPARGSEPVS